MIIIETNENIALISLLILNASLFYLKFNNSNKYLSFLSIIGLYAFSIYLVISGIISIKKRKNNKNKGFSKYILGIFFIITGLFGLYSMPVFFNAYYLNIK